MEPISKDQGERYSVYMASCANGTLYVGYTTHVSQRLASHNAGHGGRYTPANRPLTLVARWAFNRRRGALRAEPQLQRLSSGEKWAVLASTNPPLGEGNDDG